MEKTRSHNIKLINLPRPPKDAVGTKEIEVSAALGDIYVYIHEKFPESKAKYEILNTVYGEIIDIFN